MGRNKNIRVAYILGGENESFPKIILLRRIILSEEFVLLGKLRMILSEE